MTCPCCGGEKRPRSGIAFIEHSKHLFADGQLFPLSNTEFALLKVTVDARGHTVPSWYLMATLYIAGAYCTQEKVDATLRNARDLLKGTRVVLEEGGGGWRAIVLKP